MFKMHALQVMVPTAAFAQDEGSDRIFTECNDQLQVYGLQLTYHKIADHDL